MVRSISVVVCTLPPARNTHRRLSRADTMQICSNPGEAAYRAAAIYRVSVLRRVISLSVNCMMTSVASTGQPRCVRSRKASV